MNEYYQTYNMWMAYNAEGNTKNNEYFSIEIISMYVRLFKLVEMNDFYGENKIWANENLGNPAINLHFVTSLFELCRFNAMPYGYEKLYSDKSYHQNKGYISVKLNKTANK